MPAVPCTNHPSELTFLRCGRCDKPFCVACMVDTPVGKKCRPCAQNKTHITESTPRNVLLGFLGALVAAVPLGVILQEIGFWLLAFPYGAMVAQVALWAGQRRRSLAMQVAAGLAAAVGGLVGAGLHFSMGPMDPRATGFYLYQVVAPGALIATGIGVAVAVSRVRFL